MWRYETGQSHWEPLQGLNENLLPSRVDAWAEFCSKVRLRTERNHLTRAHNISLTSHWRRNAPAWRVAGWPTTTSELLVYTHTDLQSAGGGNLIKASGSWRLGVSVCDSAQLSPTRRYPFFSTLKRTLSLPFRFAQANKQCPQWGQKSFFKVSFVAGPLWWTGSLFKKQINKMRTGLNRGRK